MIEKNPMSSSIILIGPSGAGKSTLAPLLAGRLNWQAVELDTLRWTYYAEVGYDPALAEQIRQQGGMIALARHWRPFDLYGLERVLQDYPTEHVISLGAGHSVFDDPEQFERAQQVLAPFPHIILLLPTPDIEESAHILRDRLAAKEPDLHEGFLEVITRINREFMQHPSNRRLATQLVYTHGRTPDEVCDEIYARVT